MNHDRPSPRLTSRPGEDDERAFLAAYDASEFPHPSLAVDVATMTTSGGALHALLVRRIEHPAKGRWALPGGFVGVDESLDRAAKRVLRAKAGLTDIFLAQLYTFGAVNRDPRTRVISVAYYALVESGRLLQAKPEVGEAVVARIDLPPNVGRTGTVRATDSAGRRLRLAFDHAEILRIVVERMRETLEHAPLGFQLLPPRFTLRQLQEVHESILGRALNKDSFRRSVLTRGLVVPTGATESGVPYRPAELYRYAQAAVAMGRERR